MVFFQTDLHLKQTDEGAHERQPHRARDDQKHANERHHHPNEEIGFLEKRIQGPSSRAQWECCSSMASRQELPI